MDKPNDSSAAREQPIPPALVRQRTGWSARAQQYPVFGPTWYAYRTRAYLIPVAILTAFLLMMWFVVPDSVSRIKLFLALGASWLVVVAALFLGRGLAVLVCRRGWPRQKEITGVLLALFTGIAVAAFFTQFTHVQSDMPTPAETAAAASISHATTFLLNLALWAALLLWLGGTRDFLTYLRQRRSIQEARLREQMERYKDERNQVAMRLSVLASQIEPHFLFNTLSGVRAAMLNDPARGVVIIDHLVDYLRATIPQIRSEGGHLLMPLRGQFEAARAYLGVIHTRIPRLSFRLDCPDALLDYAMPPLMLISLVENAVKHGIEPKKGPVTIAVTAQRQLLDGADKLVLTVADDGVGFGSASSGSGIGLSNIRERLHHLYGDQAALKLTAREPGGLEASLVLPLHTLPHGT